MEVVETVLPWLGTLCCVVTLLVTVETGDMSQVFESSTGSVGNVWAEPKLFQAFIPSQSTSLPSLTGYAQPEL